MQSIKRVIALKDKYANFHSIRESINGLLTLSPQYVIFTCLTYEDGIGGREG